MLLSESTLLHGTSAIEAQPRKASISPTGVAKTQSRRPGLTRRRKLSISGLYRMQVNTTEATSKHALANPASCRQSALAAYINSQILHERLHEGGDSPKKHTNDVGLEKIASSSPTHLATVYLDLTSLSTNILFFDALKFPCNPADYAQMNRLTPLSSTVAYIDPLSSTHLSFATLRGSQRNAWNTPFGLFLGRGKLDVFETIQSVPLWDVRHADRNLPNAHNTNKASDHAALPLQLDTTSSPLFVPSPVPLRPSPLSMSSMLRRLSSARRPLLVDSANVRLSLIEEESDNGLLSPANECVETRHKAADEHSGMDEILCQLETLALEVKGLPIPEPHLAGWRDHFEDSAVASDSEEETNAMSRNLRNAVDPKYKDMTYLDSSPSTPSEDLFDDISYHSHGGSRRPSLESNTHDSSESSSSRSTGDFMFATFILPPVLASVPELANVQRHPKLVKTLGLDSPRRTPSSETMARVQVSKVPPTALRKQKRSVTPHSLSFRSSRSRAPIASSEVFSKPLPPRPSKTFQTSGLGKLIMAQKHTMQRRSTLPSSSTSTGRLFYSPRRRASESAKLTLGKL